MGLSNVHDVIGGTDRFGFQNFCSPGIDIHNMDEVDAHQGIHTMNQVDAHHDIHTMDQLDAHQDIYTVDQVDAHQDIHLWTKLMDIVD